MTEFYGLGYTQGGYAPLEEETPPVVVHPPASIAPRARLLIDWFNDVNPAEAPPDPVWTDHTAMIRQSQGFSFKRGRSRALDKVEAGTFTTTLWDPDGDLDPENTDSPYYPFVRPMRRMRLEALVASTSLPFMTGGGSLTGAPDPDAMELTGGGEGDIATSIFDGLIESFRYTYARGFDPQVQIGAVDWLGALARQRFTLDLTNPVTADPYTVYAINRINAILDTAAFTTRRGGELERPDLPDQPDYNRSTQVAMINYQDQPMLEPILDAAAVDGGNFYADREGGYTYLGPGMRVRPADDRFIFARGFVEFADVDFVYDESVIYNDIRINFQGGVTPFEDEASQAWAFQRRLDVNLPFNTSEDVDERGTELIEQYGEPKRIVQRLDLSNTISDWTTFLRGDLWTKCLVRVQLPHGQIVEQISLIEGIELSSPNFMDWRPVLWLSPAPFPNLLPDDLADFEDSEVGWVAETNCTVELTNWPTVFHGSHGMVILPTTADDVAARTYSVAIEGSTEYRANVKTRLQLFGLGFGQEVFGHVEIEWRDATDVLLSTLIGDTATIGGQRIATLTAEGRSPSGARFARLRIAIEDAPEPEPFPGFTQGFIVDANRLYRTR